MTKFQRKKKQEYNLKINFFRKELGKFNKNKNKNNLI